VNAGAFDAEEFLRRVAERGELTADEARERARAVFVALREAVSDGELRDWQFDLSTDYVDLAARAIPLDDFVHQVAEREGELDVIAREHARAVLTTVREAVTIDEWQDTLAELPREYEAVL
jgi:uncharacterized protein (DUF2267 family)